MGGWSTTTEFLREDGTTARTVEGTNRFEWVVTDGWRVRSPALESRFTCFEVTADGSRFRMEYSSHRGRAWTPGNRQLFPVLLRTSRCGLG
jgi:hypothetical protein